MIAIDLGKQQALDADPRTIQQINFTANLDRPGNTTIFFIIMFFIIEKAKKNCLRHFTRNCESFVNSILLRDLIFNSIKRHNTAV